ncbi:MAG: hypothetical protein RBT47_02000 [Anaerolineae bacterium]|jgi:hypothetical protein|nr:hypothetical protein [Anaerolineae bacterium]
MKRVQKFMLILTVLVLVSVVLLASGCSQGGAATAGGDAASGASASGDASLPEMDDSTVLALGTLLLEETENAVTPEQAAALLPLWQAIRGGGLQGNAETEAVLKQIKAQMTAEQLGAIDAMELTAEDMSTWMEESGMDMEAPGPMGTPGAMPGGTPGVVPEGGRGGGQGAMPEGTPRARPGGGGPGGGQGAMPEGTPGAMSGGGRPGGAGGPAGGGAGGAGMLIWPLVELLTQRAAE